MTAPVELAPAFLGAKPAVNDSAFVASNAVLLGNVEVGADSSIWFGCVLRGDVQAIRIGMRSNIQDGTIIHCSTNGNPTQIGNDVTVGHAAVLHSCTIGDGAFVGIGARILDGAVIESGAMIAAGAVVTPGKVVGSGELWAGNPARLLRPLTDIDRNAMQRNAQRYVLLARHYRSQHPHTYNWSTSI
ncbi:gamma carbonic anhydrase family protein [Noviherbaspirillum denitrificans]|uniref:Gamma carbonic anhydrase family protein n=1 Tax=Noviherbaspirillum denitrificans TaxID=1968433 RepID=A0A254TKQ3_9BURK|nr:gamma carbonic anhydrase family protein [Noviherbaspirillum denitrificans]OWW21183.1 gamma carbonic anhydrase family protein [Noviherbaspirillum denitrificans]